MILAITMCMSIGFYNLAILIPFSHDLYSISRAEAPRSMFYQRSTFCICHQDSFLRTEVKIFFTNEEKEFW